MTYDSLKEAFLKTCDWCKKQCNDLKDKDSFKELEETIGHTIRHQKPRIAILSLICILCLLIYYAFDVDLFKHLFAEFIGVIFLFVLIEHGLDKLDSGISDNKKLLDEMDKFIDDIETGKEQLIIYDIYLFNILKDVKNEANNRRDRLSKNIKSALQKNLKFKVHILLLDHNDVLATKKYIDQRVAQLLKSKPNESKPYDKIQIEDNIRKDIGTCNKIIDKIINDIHEEDKSLKDRLVLQRYIEAPLFAMYYLDGKAYLSFFSEEGFSANSHQLYLPDRAGLSGKVLSIFLERYKEIWNKYPNEQKTREKSSCDS